MRKKFLLSACLSIFIIAIMGIAYFLSSAKIDEVITLAPDEGETKIKPQDPGGMVIPNSDSLVYDTIYKGPAKKDKVHILPSPENPIEIVRKAKIQAKFLDSIDEILSNIEYYEDKVLTDDNSDNDSMDYIMPNKLLTRDMAEEQAGDEIIVIPGTKLNVAKAIEERYKNIDKGTINQTGKGYKIQLSSAYSLSDANKQWEKMKRKYPKILHGANLITQKVEGKNERIFYLVMAGSYQSLNQAKIVCKKLSLKRQNCIVTK